MQLFMYVDSPELDEVAEPVYGAVSTWVSDCNCTAEAIDAVDPTTGMRRVGLHLQTSKKAVLKKALDALNELAKLHKVDFSVGYVDDDSVAHKVCYFGDEEGRPDVSEIGSYLGLKR